MFRSGRSPLTRSFRPTLIQLPWNFRAVCARGRVRLFLEAAGVLASWSPGLWQCCFEGGTDKSARRGRRGMANYDDVSVWFMCGVLAWRRTTLGPGLARCSDEPWVSPHARSGALRVGGHRSAGWTVIVFFLARIARARCACFSGALCCSAPGASARSSPAALGHSETLWGVPLAALGVHPPGHSGWQEGAVLWGLSL